MSRKLFLTILLFIFVGISCKLPPEQVAQKTPKQKGGTLVAALRSDIDNLNPLLSQTADSGNIRTLLFLSTMRFDNDFKLQTSETLPCLVKSWRFENLQAGLIDGQVKWDGRNDRGVQVLNGVYLCQIVITPKNGGSGQTYMTKIAYIK